MSTLLLSMTDAALLELWCGGQGRAGDALVRRHYATIAAFIRGRCARDADDLTQQTFQRLCRAKEQLRSAASIRSWLFRTARNIMIDEWRRRRPENGPEDPSVTADVAPAGEATDSFQRERLAAAWRHLPPNEQRVLYLYYWEEQTQSEIAADTGMPLGTVKTRSIQGHQRLREQLRTETSPDPPRHCEAPVRRRPGRQPRTV